jgi:hypothetical protein
MIRRVVNVEIKQYEARTYGLFRSRSRNTRIYFIDPKRGDVTDPERTYRNLLPEIYEQMAGHSNPFVPLPLPQRIRAVWSDDESAMKLFADGFHGFLVLAHLRVQEDQESPVDDAGAMDSVGTLKNTSEHREVIR